MKLRMDEGLGVHEGDNSTLTAWFILRGGLNDR